MSKGYVYVLSNSAMPGLLKIGRTRRSVIRRSEELFQTGVPTPFKVEAEFVATNCAQLETEVHEILDEHRISPNREFFRISVKEAVDCIQETRKEILCSLVYECDEDLHVVADEEYIFEDCVAQAVHNLGISSRDLSYVLQDLKFSEIWLSVQRVALKNRPFRERNRDVMKRHSEEIDRLALEGEGGAK